MSSQTTCTLTSTGQVDVGVHVFEVMLEDFPKKNITLTYADGTSEDRVASNMASPPLCKVKLQFAVESESLDRGTQLDQLSETLTTNRNVSSCSSLH